MKQICLFLVLTAFTFSMQAQVNPTEKKLAEQLVFNHAKKIGLEQTDLQELNVSSTYLREENNIRMLYLQQQFQGIPVHNKMLVLAFQHGNLVSQTGYFIRQMAQRINLVATSTVIAPDKALSIAIQEQGISMNEVPQIIHQTDKSIVYHHSNYSTVDMEVKKVWMPIENDKAVMLTWQVEIAPVKTSDHWLIRIDAKTGKVIDKNNYTVYENFNELGSALKQLQQEVKASEVEANNHSNAFQENVDNNNAPSAVTNATYRVIPFPAESPMHPGGTASLVTNPWLNAPGNATSLNWHYNGTTYYDSTRGNNVWAQEDRDNSNTTYGRAGVSSTAQPNLTIDYVPDYTVAPTTTTFQRFATTNLFYWNNIIHDILYQYGFDEVSGNFQSSNQGRGGSGNDYVVADAQDGGGTNNANFSTPVDGSLPRMQMYLGTNVTPNRDGDLDNGVISHEYGHGLSNRLTGGPSNSSCLSHAEQGGEGWSDYLALMLTTNWNTATVNDGTLSRPIGNYLFGQTVSGAGIRTYPYSTNMTVNPNNYGMMATTTGSVHRIGEIWCSALWDMTWEIIAMDGINTNLFNPTGTGGNSVALKLVLEGMRLQPCSPGYIDARNAILKADTLFYGAKYSCAIWKSFARRGMGRFASQGSSSSYTDQVADYTDNGGISLRLTQSVTQQQEGLNVSYTTTVSAGTCGAINNYIIRDTLPLNVTYVSGGSYDASNRVVSFPVNLSVGSSQSYTYTISINNGSYYAPVVLLDETVPTTSLPTGWVTSSTTTTLWTTSTAQKVSAPNSLFTQNLTSVSDQKLETASFIVPSNPPYFTFQGYINSEASWDGGVVEITTNNGTTWTDLGSRIVSGGYNSALSSSTNPLSGRSTYNGNSNGFVKTSINLTTYAGQTVKIRFRFGSDASVAGTGWYVDDIQMKDIAQVNIRSNLFNNNNVLVANADTATIILQASNCIAGSISTQPSSVGICSGENYGFSVAASGTSLTYQWQQSTNGGSSFQDIAGATTSSLNYAGSSIANNGTLYRCVINGSCTSNLISNQVTVNVTALPSTPAGISVSRCGIGSVVLAVTPVSGLTTDWYAVSSGGTALTTGSDNFSTGLLTNTTTFYAQSRTNGTGCLSATRTPVVATILQNSSSSTTISACGSYSWNGTTYTQSGSYTYSTLNAAGCDSTAVLNLTIKTPSSSSATISACDSYSWNGLTYTQSGNYTYSTLNAAGCDSVALLHLTLSSSVSSTQSVNSCDNYYWNGSLYTVSGTYSYLTTTNTGCDSTAFLQLTIGKNSTSTTSVGICSDQLPYQWNGLNITAGGLHVATLVNASGCDSIARLLLDVTQLPTAYQVTGGGTYSVGGSGVVVGLSGSESGIQYQLFCNAQPIGAPITGNGSLLNFGLQTTEGAYTIIAGNGTVCPNNMSGQVSVSISYAPPTSFAVTGGGTYCSNAAGVPVGLSGSELGVSYQLMRSNGTVNVGLPLAGTGSSLNFGNQTLTDTYTVKAINIVNSSFTLMSGSAIVRIASSTAAASTPGTITGPANVCMYVGQGTASYTIRQVTNATSYLWTVPVGMSIISSAIDTMLTVSISSGFTTGAISVVSKNACFNNSTSTARTLSISKTVPSAPSAIYGSVDVCNFIGNASSSSPVRYYVNRVANALSYTWTVPTGVTLLSGQGDTAVDLVFASSFVSGSITVRSVSACGTSTTAKSLTVYKRVAATPGTIQKEFVPSTIAVTSVCGLNSENYKIRKVTYATGYIWNFASGIGSSISHVNSSGINDTAIAVDFAGTFTRDTLKVFAITSCNISAAKTLVLTRLNVAPAVTTLTGSATPCIGNVLSYTAIAATPTTAQSPVSVYRWSKPNNTIIVSANADSSEVQISFNTGFTGGSISVKGQTACGVAGTAKSLTLQYATPTPSSIVSSTGTYNACIGNLITYSVVVAAPSSSQRAASVYRWTKPANTTIVSANTDSSSITVSFNAGYTGGSLTVKGQTACGVLGSAKSQVLTHTGCAAGTFAKVQPIIAENPETAISVYPNPGKGSFRVSLNNGSFINQLIISEASGKVVYQKNNIAVSEILIAENLPAGIYFINVVGNGRRYTTRLLRN